MFNVETFAAVSVPFCDIVQMPLHHVACPLEKYLSVPVALW